MMAQPLQQLDRMASASERQKRVLLVDDDEDTRESVAELFELLGHQCVTAATAAEALELLEGLDPHVIFVDIGLPDMPGHELARTIRGLDRPQVPIIAVSGRAQPSDIARSLDHGIDLHIPKPIGYEVLRRIVGDAASRDVTDVRMPAPARPRVANRAPGSARTARSARRGCR